jgi:predicted DNA-binding transcriptional regulator YafY
MAEEEGRHVNKILGLKILNILERYTDCDHRLSQMEIVELLKKNYGLAVDRKAVKRNLDSLIEADYDIECSQSSRLGKQGVEENLSYGWYINNRFSDSELRLLIDSVLFSNHIPPNQRKELIEKLGGLSNIYFDAKIAHIRTLRIQNITNRQLFYTIDILDSAIEEHKQVSFLYSDFGVDKKLHPRKGSGGKERVYLVNPYQMAAVNGHYYLIANYDKYDNIAHFRIDRISDIALLDTPSKALRKVKGLEKGTPVKFRASRDIIGDIIDRFGLKVSFSDISETEITVSLTANESDIFYWLMQYGEHTETLEPASLRKQIITSVKDMGKKYGLQKLTHLPR